MKIRDSGMPEEAYWETLFDVPRIVDWIKAVNCHDVAELGCGYGTFTVPIAQRVTGTVYAFDVDPAMLVRTVQRAKGLPVVTQQRDVVADGFGVFADCVLLFNILHGEQPIELLRHAANALYSDGEVLVIHWRHEQTPRGPSLNIRPKPEQVIDWAREADLEPVGGVAELPPWHYGIRFQLEE